MAEMGLGFGSEFQLLRFLGHHRNTLNKLINENTHLKGEILWLDFPKNLNRLSLDGEYTGINFIENEVCKELFSLLEIEKIKTGWRNYWSANGMQANLDGVILHKHDNKLELVLVEAKGCLKELESNTNSGSNEKIKNAFINTQNHLNISSDNWFGKYYQLANRLALANYFNNCSEVRIQTSLLYIYFLNGFEKRKLERRNIVTIKNQSVDKQSDWEQAIKRQYDELGLNDAVSQNIAKIFIDCK